MASKQAQAAAAERGTQADRDFAQEAQAPGAPTATQDPQAPAPFDALDATGQPTVASQALAGSGNGSLDWKARLHRAKMKSAAKHANANLVQRIGEKIDLTGAICVEMENSEYDYNQKGVLFVREQDGEATVSDIYGAAGVESLRALVDELGPGPWPEAVPVIVMQVVTKYKKGNNEDDMACRVVPAW